MIINTSLASCSDDDDDNNPVVAQKGSEPLKCKKPDYLQNGDKVALISPSYFTPMENVEKTADVLRSWGLDPVVGPNVGKTFAGKYAGTVDEILSDLQWALNDPSIKAIICNRGGYGTIHLVGQQLMKEMAAHPKWLVGFSDITTLHEMESCAGVMSIHGTMSSFLAKGGMDPTSTLMCDLLKGIVPRYEIAAHPMNITGKATGTLVGGNLMTFAPVVGSSADATAYKDIILFIEEVEESMHNIDRQVNMLRLTGVLDRCRGIILGEFTDCGHDLDYASAGHGDWNLPLVMGAPVSLDVRSDGATLEFDIDGRQQVIIAPLQ